MTLERIDTRHHSEVAITGREWYDNVGYWFSFNHHHEFRSEGLAASSPVREGGVGSTISYLSAEGAPRLVPALWASDHRE
ncbi:MAG: hypothetical protein M3R67_05060 [Acidobacteriota bacterium]|nr:hypothetical protein [Acidobacteriota bacterium]